MLILVFAFESEVKLADELLPHCVSHLHFLKKLILGQIVLRIMLYIILVILPGISSISEENKKHEDNL